MKILSPVLGQFANGEYAWWCPGCRHAHHVPTGGGPHPIWQFNGNVDRPSFTPSVRHFLPADEHGPEGTFCHYIITDGQIGFCGDCTHALNGQTVPMVPLADHQDYGWPD